MNDDNVMYIVEKVSFSIMGVTLHSIFYSRTNIISGKKTIFDISNRVLM